MRKRFIAAVLLAALGGCARIEEEHIPLNQYGRADTQFTNKAPTVYYTVERGTLPLAYRKVRISLLGKRTILEERYYYLDETTLEMMWKLSDDHYELKLPDGSIISASKGRVVRSEADFHAKALRPCMPSERPNWPNYSGIVWCAWDGNKIGPAEAPRKV